ncbi:MAG: hypothetical protein OSB62_02880 [Alphaproteobacteria bacterium]|nr:hypothetical protein [Alphaproteobacteria bacterium]
MFNKAFSTRIAIMLVLVVAAFAALYVAHGQFNVPIPFKALMAMAAMLTLPYPLVMGTFAVVCYQKKLF